MLDSAIGTKTCAPVVLRPRRARDGRVGPVVISDSSSASDNESTASDSSSVVLTRRRRAPMLPPSENEEDESLARCPIYCMSSSKCRFPFSSNMSTKAIHRKQYFKIVGVCSI